MIDSSNSDSGNDSDSSIPHLPKSTIKEVKPKTKQKHIFKTNLLNLKNKNLMPRSLPILSIGTPNLSPLYPHLTTLQLSNDISLPSPNYKSDSNLHNNLSPHRAQIPLISPPSFLIPLL